MRHIVLSAMQSEVISVGGVVSDVTLAAPRWATIFQEDHDVFWLVDGATTGFDFHFTPPADSTDVDNYVQLEFEHKVSAKVFEEYYCGNIVKQDRDFVWWLTALGVVDKDHSGFIKIRIVNDFSRPAGTSINDCT